VDTEVKADATDTRNSLISRRRGLLFLGFAAILTVSGCATIARGETDEVPVDVAEAQIEATTTTAAPIHEPEPSTSAPPATAEPTPVETPTEEAPTESREPDEPERDQAPDDVYPIRVRIPEIGVDADVIDLGLNQDGTLEVPKDFAQTGWYTGRSVPGNVGPSVVVGHVDSKTGPAVFFRLRDLEAGNTIEIHRSDGMVALFRVTEAELVLKDEFPTDQVYGSTAEPTLRLITCGGSFDQSAGSYRGNLIVFAEHLGTDEPPNGQATS
jgi:sortase (surface protein transpeptidase)